MDWDDSDPMTLNASAMREAVPPTLPVGQKKTKAKFGINVDTEFQSPTNNTNATLGFAGRKTSQGRLSSNSRGGDVLISGARAEVPRKVIVPGQSLSINQPQQISMDTFSRAVVSTNTHGRKPELTLVSSKASNGYSGFQENTHSNNVSPNTPAVSKTMQRLLPNNAATHTGARSQSADLAFIGHVDPSRTTTTSTTTHRPSSRNSTQTKGPGRPAIQSYEEKIRAKQVEEESNLRPRSREHNNNYPSSHSLPIRPSFTTPHNKNANSHNTSNTSNTTNNNTRSTRNSARKSPSNEVIDLVDSDIEEVESIHLVQQQQDSDIFRLYGSLPGFTDQQKRNAFSKTEERLEVNHIYLGIYRFDSSNNSNSSARKLYLRVDGGNNQCILLGLNNDADTLNTSDPDGTVGTDPIEIEEIPFDKIKKIICGPVSANSSQAFITLSVHSDLSLNCVNVGPNCMLCPTLTQNAEDSGKYVLIMLSTKHLQLFVDQMKAVPFVSKKKNLNGWLSYRSNWLSWETKDFLFAHINRNEHSIEELRERALLEQDIKSKNQRRKNRSSLRNGGYGDGAVADPEDCLTYAMYPIEPEVLDAITIFKGDLKKLAPEEYLNDNLIDLKIKHLAATQLTPAQVAAIHVFNCMFYTCLTTPKSPEQGHKVVSRWTNKVDLFAKDYIIIPINYSYHWSLAVIIRPGAVKTSLAELQADVANWRNWTNNNNSNSNSNSQPNSAKKGAGSANRKKNITAVDNVVQDLTLSNSNTQNSAANGSEEAPENDNAEGSSPSELEQEEVNGGDADNSSAENMDAIQDEDTHAVITAETASTPAEQQVLDILKSLVNSTSKHKSSSSSATSPIANSDRVHSVSEKEEETSVNRTCIIHMDSLGMHSTAAVGKALRSYLRFEWEARKKAELDAELDALLKNDVNKNMSEEDVAKMKKSLEVRRLKVFNSINVTKIKVPMQANGYDCGLFVTKFAELVLRTQPSSTEADIASKFGNILRSDAFSQADVDGERKNMLAMIEGIRKDWENLRHQLKLQQQQQSEAAAQSATSESETNQNNCNDDGEGEVAAGDDADHRMECNNEGEEAGGENSVKDEGEEDLGAVYADVPVASIKSSRNHAHYSSSAGKKRLTVAEEDHQSASRKADTDFDSLISGDTGRSPPIRSSSSSNSNSNSNSAGDELDTQDSARYMDCGDGGESKAQDETPVLSVPQSSDHTQQSQSTVSSSPGNASPPGGERVEGDRKRKKEQKRKRSDREKDRADLGAEPLATPAFAATAVAVDVASTNDATPTALGKSLSRTTSSVAAAILPDGTLPVEIKGGFSYKELPSSTRHKHKKIRQDREESGTVGSPSPVAMARESASKSNIVPVDMSTLGGPLLSVDASSDRMDTSVNITVTAGPDGTAEDLGEDVGEPVQTAYSTDHLKHLTLKQARLSSGAPAASVGGDRSVTKQYANTALDFLNQAPEDHTLGPAHTSSQDKHKKYGKK